MYKIWKLSEAISDHDGRVWGGWLYCKSKTSRKRSLVKMTKKKRTVGGGRRSERAMQARTGVGTGVGSSLALREATNSQWEGTGHSSLWGVGLKRGSRRDWTRAVPCFKIWWSHTWCYSKVSRSHVVRRANWCCPGTAGLFPAPGGRSAGEVGARSERKPTFHTSEEMAVAGEITVDIDNNTSIWAWCWFDCIYTNAWK